MTLIIQSLPFEIIELISSNICTNDLLTAISVSKAWYYSFHTFIYRSLTLDKYAKQKTILHAFHSDKLPGHLVRSLTLQNIQLSEHEVHSLTKMFSDIDTLTIDWNIWGPLPFHSYFDPEALISYIHPPQGLPPSLYHLFQHYGSQNLKQLSIDCLNHDSIDIWSLLALCPRLTSLKLKNLNHEHIITLGYLETIHQLCPQLNSLIIKCTVADPNPALLPQFNERNRAIVLSPTPLKVFFLASKSGSAKWPYWLPYFSIKYPNLQHLRFKHCGLGKDGNRQSQSVPEQVFTLFSHSCKQLKSIRWNKITVQQDQQMRLFNLGQEDHCQQKQPFQHLQSIEAYENFRAPGALLHSPILQQNSSISTLLTSLTLGQPPANVSTVQVLKTIGQSQHLLHLKIQECFIDPDIAYSMDDILTFCKHLRSLYIKDIHLNCSTSNTSTTTATIGTPTEAQQPHPLKRLVLKRSSFTGGVFETVSDRCHHLEHVELLGCFQTDRRDQVRIALPKQHLSTLKIQSLRTRSYYAGCRIRFFVVGNIWYYMSQYDIRAHPIGQKLYFQKFRNIEYARRFDRLKDEDIQELNSLVTTKTLKAWDIEAAKQTLQCPRSLGIDESQWDPENIYYSGIVKIVCESIQTLIINDKLVVIN